MTNLEQTIVSTASQRLRELEDFIESGTPENRANAMRDLFALVELAKIQDSGMSEQAAVELIQLESQAQALMRSVVKRLHPATQSPEDFEGVYLREDETKALTAKPDN